MTRIDTNVGVKYSWRIWGLFVIAMINTKLSTDPSTAKSPNTPEAMLDSRSEYTLVVFADAIESFVSFRVHQHSV